MKRLLILLFPVFTLKAQFLWQLYPDTVVKWNYVDGDEFNVDAINTDKWHLGFPWSRSMFSTDNYILDGNFTLANGSCNFVVKKLDSLITLQDFETTPSALKKNSITVENGNKYKFKYSTALLWSKKSYKYGYFEIKFKGVEGQGVWPAFWLYGGNPNYEIDFFELKGENEQKIHVDVHCPSGCADFNENIFARQHVWGHWVNTDQKLKSGFNIIAGEWAKNSIKWYLNGHLIAYSDINMEIPMSLVVGTGVAKNNGPFKPGPNQKTPFPNYFTVDYIRVYRSDTLPNPTSIKEMLSRVSTSVYTDTNSFLTRRKDKKIRFLPKGIKQNIIDKPILTISISQQSEKTVTIRVLGVSETNPAKVTFLKAQNQVIDKFLFQKPGETVISFLDSKIFQILIEGNNQTIKELITLE